MNILKKLFKRYRAPEKELDYLESWKKLNPVTKPVAARTMRKVSFVRKLRSTGDR